MGPDVSTSASPEREPGPDEVALGEGAGTLRIAADGEIDIMTAGDLHRRVLEVLRRHRPRRLEIDCADVTFLDAAGIRALRMSQADAAQLGCEVTLVRASPITRRVLGIVGLLHAFGLGSPAPLRVPRPRSMS